MVQVSSYPLHSTFHAALLTFLEAAFSINRHLPSTATALSHSQSSHHLHLPSPYQPPRPLSLSPHLRPTTLSPSLSTYFPPDQLPRVYLLAFILHLTFSNLRLPPFKTHPLLTDHKPQIGVICKPRPIIRLMLYILLVAEPRLHRVPRGKHDGAHDVIGHYRGGFAHGFSEGGAGRGAGELLLCVGEALVKNYLAVGGCGGEHWGWRTIPVCRR